MKTLRARDVLGELMAPSKGVYTLLVMKRLFVDRTHGLQHPPPQRKEKVT